jgi:hypothetical protein
MVESNKINYKISKIENSKGQQLGNDTLKIYEVNPQIKNKSKISINNICKHVKYLLEQLKDNDIKGEIIISTHDDFQTSWFSGNATDIQTEEPHVYSSVDYDGEVTSDKSFDDFRIYILVKTEDGNKLEDKTKKELPKRTLEVNNKSKKGLKPIFYHSHIDNTNIYDYVKDGELHENKTFNELVKYHKHPEKSGYRLIRDFKNGDLIQLYNDYIKISDSVKKQTNGDVDMYKIGSLKDTVLYEFKNRSPELEISDFPEEQVSWLEKSSRAPFRVSTATVKKPYEGQAYSYDVNSFYSFIEADIGFDFPTEPGKFKIKDKIKFNKLAIYRAIVKGKVNPFLFSKNPINMYVSTELQKAKEYGYEIELIQDGKPNCLEFKSIVNSKDIFKDYVDYFYNLKKDNSLIKPFLSELHGFLLEGSANFHHTYKDIDDFNIRGNKVIKKINPTKSGTQMTFISANNQFKTPYWVMKTFLYATARNLIPAYYENQLDKVIRVVTDGFTLTEPTINTQLLNPKKIGFLKVELDKTGLIKMTSSVVYKYDEKNEVWTK